MTKNPKKTDEQLDRRIAELASRLAERKKAGGNQAGLAAGLRAEILAAWHGSGMPMGSFGERVGVSGQSIGNWRKAEAKKQTKVAPRRKKQFREVRVVPERAARPAPGSRRGFELALPGGARVTGLGMEDIGQLLRMQEVAR